MSDLRAWVVAELDETTQRLRHQVLELVPAERRLEAPGGGSSIMWNLFHVARHAALALAVLTDRPEADGWAGPLADDLRLKVPGGSGLEEAEQPWVGELDPGGVEADLLAVLGRARRFVVRKAVGEMDQRPDVTAALVAAGVDLERFGWLAGQWQGHAVSFFVRWPLIGHVGNHVGEMVATRNRLGLSPF